MIDETNFGLLECLFYDLNYLLLFEIPAMLSN